MVALGPISQTQAQFHQHSDTSSSVQSLNCCTVLFKKNFQKKLSIALEGRRKNTTEAVKAAKEWLIHNPLQLPLPPAVGGNLWSMNGHIIFSTHQKKATLP